MSDTPIKTIDLKNSDKIEINITGEDNKQTINLEIKVKDASAYTNQFAFNNTKVKYSGYATFTGKCIHIYPALTYNYSLTNVSVNLSNINIKVEDLNITTSDPTKFMYSPAITVVGCNNLNIQNCYIGANLPTQWGYILYSLKLTARCLIRKLFYNNFLICK